MNNDERYIRQKMGGRNPFRVPEGYFSKFASELMESLPEREPVEVKPRPALSIALRRALLAAACVCIVALGLAVMLAKMDGAVAPGPQPQATAAADTYEDDVADYAMIDNGEIYAYLSADQ